MQIKKHIALLLAFFFLISNSGLAFNVHYCGEKIAAISSVFSDEEMCNMPVREEKSCCAEKEIVHKKCCSDKELNLKDTSEKFAFKSITFDFDLFFFETPFKRIYFNSIKSSCKSQYLIYCCEANAPPLYQLYCQYTFYA